MQAARPEMRLLTWHGSWTKPVGLTSTSSAWLWSSFPGGAALAFSAVALAEWTVNASATWGQVLAGAAVSAPTAVTAAVLLLAAFLLLAMILMLPCLAVTAWSRPGPLPDPLLFPLPLPLPLVLP